MNDINSEPRTANKPDHGSASCRVEQRANDSEVAWVSLKHEGKMNAIGSTMVADLLEIFAELNNNGQLRVVVITGDGDRAFVGGAFLPELDGLNPDSARAFITRLHMACQAVRDCPVPVIGRLRGLLSRCGGRTRCLL
jgi:enoyl-CoA hydratase